MATQLCRQFPTDNPQVIDNLRTVFTISVNTRHWSYLWVLLAMKSASVVQRGNFLFGNLQQRWERRLDISRGLKRGVKFRLQSWSAKLPPCSKPTLNDSSNSPRPTNSSSSKQISTHDTSLRFCFTERVAMPIQDRANLFPEISREEIVRQADLLDRAYREIAGARAVLGTRFDHVYEQVIYPKYEIGLVEHIDLGVDEQGAKIFGYFDPRENVAYIDVSLRNDPRREFTCWQRLPGRAGRSARAVPRTAAFGLAPRAPWRGPPTKRGTRGPSGG